MRVTSVVSRPIERCSLRVVAVLSAIAAAFAASFAHAAGPVVISQVYGGGGNTNAPFKNDFVELVNRSDTPVDLTGWSIQYASSTGTGLFSASGKANLTGILQPGQYYLARFAGNSAAVGADLPAFDATGTQDLSATNGKVVLVNSTTGLACNGGSTLCSPAQLAQIIDLVGYGNANFFETATAPTSSNTAAGLRKAGGCTDTDNNSADFQTGAPTPRNTASPLSPCNAGNAPIVASCPTTLAAIVGVGASTTIAASDPDGIVSTAAITSSIVNGITLDNVAPGATLNATLNVSSATAIGNYNVAIAFANTDPTPQTAQCIVAVSVTPAAAAVRIRDIQGAAHLSPLRGRAVTSVPGIVTAKTTNGFWFQDPNPDASDATSEGLFVFTSTVPSVNVGDSITVSGTVTEFRPGGNTSGNLTTSEITSPSIAVLSSGNPLPAPVVIGNGGRVPPQQVIDDDATGDVETSGTFDAASDGIDFYESLEGMRVQLNNVVAVGPSVAFGEIPVVGDNGSNAALRTPRGGVLIRANDFNPERVILDDGLTATPTTVNVGDTAPAAVGVLDYSFGNFKLLVTTTPAFANNGLSPEITPYIGNTTQLTVGSFNVENLAASNPPAKFDALASQIVVNLRSPDVIALMEVQDNNGATNDAVVDASQSFAKLIAAITAAGGPTYQFRQINPVDDQDGGEPGGNIRVGFLFNPERVSFIDRAGGTSTSATSVVAGPYGAQLSASPGRIDPTNPVFNSSRKPLVGEFLFNGQTLFLIANHFNSKGGDDPLFGQIQPPVRSSEVQRTGQATVLANFIQSLRSVDANAKIIVLGDLNDFQFSDTVTILKNASLVDLVETLDENERYTYVFDGNSQVLDHILISNALASVALPQYDIVHVNSEFAHQTSDHEPEVVQLTLPLVEVTGQLILQRSGLVFNRGTQRFVGTNTLTATTAIAGPLQVAFEGLPPGVTLANATGARNGVPYITIPQASLAAGAQAQISVQFSNPSRVAISYTNRVYSGQF